MPVDATTMMPGWQRAYEAVWSLLPITRNHVTAASSCITPGAVLHYADLSGVFLREGVVPRWDEHECDPILYTIRQLFDRMFADEPEIYGELILITDNCFPITAREPFFNHCENLREFLAKVPFVFDGDAVFIRPEARRISVFDHDGRFAHIDCYDHATRVADL